MTLHYKSTGRRTCVSVAHHISGIWEPQPSPNPREAGSRGAGVVVTPHATACLARREDGGQATLRVQYQGKPISMRPLELLYRDIPPPRGSGIEVVLTLPPGRGYATSAAASISYALLTIMHGRGETFTEAVEAAHAAEVRALTGLGDVASITGGHLLNLRLTPGPPPRGRVESLPVPPGVVVASFSLGSMDTRDMLSQRMDSFRKLGREALERLLGDPGFERFLEEARWFSRATGQLSKRVEEAVERVTRECGGCVLGFFVKKTLLVVFVEKDWAAQLPSLLEDGGVSFEFSYLHGITGNGVCLGGFRACTGRAGLP